MYLSQQQLLLFGGGVKIPLVALPFCMPRDYQVEIRVVFICRHQFIQREISTVNSLAKIRLSLLLCRWKLCRRLCFDLGGILSSLRLAPESPRPIFNLPLRFCLYTACFGWPRWCVVYAEQTSWHSCKRTNGSCLSCGCADTGIVKNAAV